MQRSQIFVQNRVFCLPHLHSTPPLGGFPSEYRHHVWHGKTRVVKKFRRYLYSFWSNSRTWQTHSHTQTHRQTLHDGIGHAYASNRVAKTIILGSDDLTKSDNKYHTKNPSIWTLERYGQIMKVADPLCLQVLIFMLIQLHDAFSCWPHLETQTDPFGVSFTYVI